MFYYRVHYRFMNPEAAQDPVTVHCQRIEYIYITEEGGKTERLDHAISFGFCVESERVGMSLKELIRKRVAPKLEDIRIKYWY